MGCLSGKRKTVYFTGVSRMTEDANFVYTSKQAMAQYILLGNKNSVDMSQALMAATQQTLPVKYNKFYRKAKKGKYHFGLPQLGSVNWEDVKLDERLPPIIEQQIGYPVELIYSKLGEANHAHFIWKMLIEDHNYNPETNIIDLKTSELKADCYLVSAQLFINQRTHDIVHDNTYFEHWGVSSTYNKTHDRAVDFNRPQLPIQTIDTVDIEDYALITYQYKVGETLTTDTFKITFEKYIQSTIVGKPIIKEADYVMASYKYIKNNITYIGFFTYTFLSKTIPEIEAIANFGNQKLGQFYPRVYSRVDSQNLNELPKTDARYRDSVMAGKVLGIDWLSWATESNKQVDGDTVHLLYTQAVPINTTDQDSLKYLFTWFHKIWLASGEVKDAIPDLVAESFYNKTGSFIDISDKVYSHSINFTAIGLNILNGNKCEVGKYQSTYVSTSDLLDMTTAYHSIVYQVDSNTYTEIRLYNLNSVQRFSGGNTVASGTAEELIIPLDKSILNEMNSKEEEILFYKSMYMIVNMSKVIKTKWYQTGVFKAIVTIASIAISVFTAGAGAPISAMIQAAVVGVAYGMAISAAVSLVAKFLVRIGVDAKIATALIVIAAIYAGFKGNIAGIKLTAVKVLEYTNIAFKVVNNMNQLQLNKLIKEMDQFRLDSLDKEKELERVKEQLATGTLPFDLFALTTGDMRRQVMINLGETPEQFLNRTVDAGNMALALPEVIHNYAELSRVIPNPLNKRSEMYYG